MESGLQANYHTPSKAIIRTDVHENAHFDSRATSSSFLQQNDASEKTESGHAKPARHPLSWSALSSAAFDALVALTPLIFIMFGALVYVNDGKPVDESSTGSQLLEAAHYVGEVTSDLLSGPTVFPILFAGIVATFLKAFAAYRLERGTSVLLLEYLLGSRSVLSALTTPLSLRAFSIAAPLLILLWALSPVGGQAALRVVYTTTKSTNISAQFSSVDFLSAYELQGPTIGLNPGQYTAITAAFTTALMSRSLTASSGQDTFGNIKIPMLESLTGASSGNASWRDLTQGQEYEYSSLAGLRTIDIGRPGLSLFNMETSYMYTNCIVTHQKNVMMQTIHNMSTYPSGGNWGMTAGLNQWLFMKSTHIPAWVIFRSYSYGSGNYGTVTTANCSLTQTYVEVSVQCSGGKCQSTAIRPSTAAHNSSALTPLSGMWNGEDDNYINFWPSFVKVFDPSLFCDSGLCMSSPIESYLLQPDSAFSNGIWDGAQGTTATSPPIWPIGDQLFSQRFTQLVNTYWIDSIAPYAITGNFSSSNTNPDSGYTPYNVVNSTGTIETEQTVLQCSRPWLAILILASSVMLLAGIVGIVLGILRRGPDLLDRFTSFLRDNPYAESLQCSSMTDATSEARRLKDTQVMLGDVRPGQMVGHVAIAVSTGERLVERLRFGKHYD